MGRSNPVRLHAAPTADDFLQIMRDLLVAFRDQPGPRAAIERHICSSVEDLPYIPLSSGGRLMARVLLAELQRVSS